MEEQSALDDRLRTIEAKLVARLGPETAIIAMENIDINYYKKDYFLVKYVEELVRKHLPFPGSISGSIGSSRHMANAKKAYVMILITQLGLKKRQLASLLNCGWRNIYNLYNDGLALLAEESKTSPFKQRYNMILHEFNLYIKSYVRKF
jgi:hypothetical protein